MSHCRGEKLSCPKAAAASCRTRAHPAARPAPSRPGALQLAGTHSRRISACTTAALLGPGSGSVLAAVGSGAVPRVLLALRGAVRGPLPAARAAPASPRRHCAGDAWGLQRPSCSPQLGENSLNSFSCFHPEQSFNQSIGY